MRRHLAVSVVCISTISPTFTSAENLVFNYINPNFGGDPFVASFLFGLAEAQRSATADLPPGSDGGGGIGGIGGGNIGGPTIVIPINTGDPTPPNVNTPGTEAQVRQIQQ